MLDRESYDLGKLRLGGKVLHSRAIAVFKCYALNYFLYLSIFK